MLKNLNALEITIDGKIYKFLCEVDAPLGAVHDAICHMKGFVMQKLNEAHAATMPNAPECTNCPEKENDGK